VPSAFKPSESDSSSAAHVEQFKRVCKILGKGAEDVRKDLFAVRMRELDEAVRVIGYDELYLLGYRDSGMPDTDANAHPDNFANADLDEATGRLVAIIRAARPAVMVTYDANGNYGHPDHINAHRIAVSAMQAAADSSRFPEAGQAFAVDKFYEVAFNRDRWTSVMEEMKERGIKLPWDFDADADAEAKPGDEPAKPEGENAEEEAFGVPEAEITTLVDVSAWAPAKRSAMECHRTQRQDFGWLLDLPDDLASRILSPESFVLTRWPHLGVAPDLHETSLFDGLEER